MDPINHKIQGTFNVISLGFHTEKDLRDLEELLATVDDAQQIHAKTILQVLDYLRHSGAQASLGHGLALIVLSIGVAADPVKAVIAPQRDLIVDIMAKNLSSGSVQYRCLDILTTLMIDKDGIRTALGSPEMSPFLSLCVQSAKIHKANMDILFGVACAVATLCLNNTRNARHAVEVGAFTLLLEVFKFTAKGVARTPRDPPEGMRHALQWSRLAIRNISLSKGVEPVVAEAVKMANFGRFGDCVAVDELKWELEHLK